MSISWTCLWTTVWYNTGVFFQARWRVYSVMYHMFLTISYFCQGTNHIKSLLRRRRKRTHTPTVPFHLHKLVWVIAFLWSPGTFDKRDSKMCLELFPSMDFLAADNVWWLWPQLYRIGGYISIYCTQGDHSMTFVPDVSCQDSKNNLPVTPGARNPRLQESAEVYKGTDEAHLHAPAC